jgi:Flp pilus assembly protein TadG
MIMGKRILAFLRNSRGSMAIETAIVAPVLVLLSLGTFDVSKIVARQHELQTGASEGEIIAMAAAQGATTNAAEIQAIIANSLNLQAEKVVVQRLYRCDASTNRVATKTDCGSSAVITSYIQIRISDTYTPVWTQFGVGGPINFSVNRMVVLLS